MSGEGLAAPVPTSPGMASNLATSHLARSGLRVNEGDLFKSKASYKTCVAMVLWNNTTSAVVAG